MHPGHVLWPASHMGVLTPRLAEVQRTTGREIVLRGLTHVTLAVLTGTPGMWWHSCSAPPNMGSDCQIRAEHRSQEGGLC